eukprot:32979-Hanusia_phi.AAC.1
MTVVVGGQLGRRWEFLLRMRQEDASAGVEPKLLQHPSWQLFALQRRRLIPDRLTAVEPQVQQDPSLVSDAARHRHASLEPAAELPLVLEHVEPFPVQQPPLQPSVILGAIRPAQSPEAVRDPVPDEAAEAEAFALDHVVPVHLVLLRALHNHPPLDRSLLHAPCSSCRSLWPRLLLAHFLHLSTQDSKLPPKGKLARQGSAGREHKAMGSPYPTRARTSGQLPLVHPRQPRQPAALLVHDDHARCSRGLSMVNLDGKGDGGGGEGWPPADDDDLACCLLRIPQRYVGVRRTSMQHSAGRRDVLPAGIVARPPAVHRLRGGVDRKSDAVAAEEAFSRGLRPQLRRRVELVDGPAPAVRTPGKQVEEGGG